MKEILIPLNFTTTPTVTDTKQSFSTSDEASGVLTFTTTVDVTGTVASLTIRNASENANRQTVLIERLDVNSSPFSYALKNPLPFGQYEGTVLLKKNLTTIASATFLFGVNSSLSAEVLPDLVKAYSLDELVKNVETEVSNLKDAFTLTVSETVKGVNKTESTLQAQENVRYLNEHTRKTNEESRIANEQARIAAELVRKDTFDTLVDSAVIEETVAQEVANEFQQIESTYANRLLSTEQQLEHAVTVSDTAALKADAMASGSPKGVYATLALLQVAYPTGTTGAYLVSADGKWYYWNGSSWVSGGVYQATSIADGSVSTSKISSAGLKPNVVQGVETLLVPSANLFNKEAVVSGGYYKGTTGEWISDQLYVSSDFIPVTKGDVYKFTKPGELARWDSRKTFISGGFTGNLNVSEDNVSFITLSVLAQDVDITMVTNQNTDVTGGYIPYYKERYTFDESWDVLGDERIHPLQIQGVETLLVRTANLFDKEVVVSGGYYKGTTGEWINDPSYVSSDFIPVTKGGFYEFTKSSEVVKWDSNKNFVKGGFSINALASEYNVSFITVGVLAKDVDITMVTNPDNLFDKEAVVSGGYYKGTTGEWIINPLYASSDFIPVTKGNVYKSIKSAEVVKWDSEKKFVSGSVTNNVNVSEDNVSFVTFGVLSVDVGTTLITMLNQSYIPYYKERYTFDESWSVSEGGDEKSNELESRTEGLESRTEELESRTYGLESRTVEFTNLYSSEYSEPIELVLNDFSGYNQPYHPSVLYIEGGFNGYKYWMVQTPYPIGGEPYMDRWECPIVYKSNDGVDWTTVANPLDDLNNAEIANRDYMSDPHMVYREDTRTLEVWYRLTRISGGTAPTKVLRKTTTDGVIWNEREEMIPETLSTDSDFVRSPSVLWDNVSKKYRLWYTNNDGVRYNTISDGGVWDANTQQNVTLSDVNNYWHMDVNYYGGQYHFLGYASGQYIVHYTSDDGLNFNRDRLILASSDGNPLYSNGLYRACSLLNEFGKVMVYFSAINYRNKTKIGLVVVDDFSKIMGGRRIASNKVVLNGGMTLEELAEELFRLKGIVDSL